MGRDPNEDNGKGVGRPRPKERKARGGCFIGLNPDKVARGEIEALAGDSRSVIQVLERAAAAGIRISLRYDSKNDAMCATATILAERFEDNQTIGAFHTGAYRALAILAHALQTRYLGLDDWRVEQLKFDLGW